VLERPSQGRVQGDLRATLRRLRGGGIVGITPDVPATPAEGTPVLLCGRTVHLRSGAFWLARHSGAPLVGYRIELCDSRRLRVCFDPAERLVDDGDVTRGLERWTAAFDRALHESPESWMFWLDRRWARALAAEKGSS
jgi:lauroyl/myristoyl acyltransferase